MFLKPGVLFSFCGVQRCVGWAHCWCVGTVLNTSTPRRLKLPAARQRCNNQRQLEAVGSGESSPPQKSRGAKLCKTQSTAGAVAACYRAALPLRCRTAAAGAVTSQVTSVTLAGLQRRSTSRRFRARTAPRCAYDGVVGSLAVPQCCSNLTQQQAALCVHELPGNTSLTQ